MQINEKVLKNITTAQKQIVFFTVGAVGIFVFFLILIYVPTKGKVSRLQSDLQEVQSLINQIEGMLGQGTSMQEGIRFLEERNKVLNSKFPEREEDGLRLLSDIARDSDVHILTIKSDRKVPFLVDQQEVVVDAKKCYKLSVSMEIESDYEHMVQYLQKLKDKLPVYMIAERLSIHKGNFGPKRLTINLKVDLFLLSSS